MASCTAWAAGAKPIAPIAIAVLRPAVDSNLGGTALDKVVEAQKVRQVMDEVLEDLLRKSTFRHDDLRDILGRNYLVRAFDCGLDTACLLQSLVALRSRSVNSVLVGAYFTTDDRYVFHIRRLDLGWGGQFVEERFVVRRSEILSPAVWRPHLARLVSDLQPTDEQPAPSAVDAGVVTPPPPVDAGAPPPPKPDAGVGNEALAGRHEPPTGRTYAGVRASTAPTIDGVLDEALWQSAPRDGRFLSATSKPYGAPAEDRTEFQVAYDEANLYVAIRCAYAKPGARDDGVPLNEWGAMLVNENVGVMIDPDDDRNHAFGFLITRTGFRADFAVADNGTDFNIEWNGIWAGAANLNAEGWAAELRIPWGTLGISAHDSSFVVGLNVGRSASSPGAVNLWSLFPAGMGPGWPPSHFGHLQLDSAIAPGQHLVLTPYVASAFRQQGTGETSRLKDLLGQGGQVAPFVGLYANLRPVRWLNMSVALNPDFSQVSLNSSESRINRFPLLLPEVREFFVEKSGLFSFGEPDAQLFFSRNIGVLHNARTYSAAPMPWGVKVTASGAGLEIGLLDAATSPATGSFSVAERFDVGRVNYQLGDWGRVGALVESRVDPHVGTYYAYGVDGRVQVLDNHLSVSGFAAQSRYVRVAGGASSVTPGLAVNGRVRWISDEFEAETSYRDVSDSFDPQMGFFVFTGARSADIRATYGPKIMADGVRVVRFTGYAARTTAAADGSVLIAEQSAKAAASFLNGATVEVTYGQEQNGVFMPFPLADDRILVAPGNYANQTLTFTLRTSQQRALSVSGTYTEGSFFDGYKRTPSLALMAHAGRYSGKLLYQLMSVEAGGVHVTGHRISSQMSYVFSPDIRSVLMVDASTFDSMAAARFVTVWQFLPASSLSLVLAKTTSHPTTFFANGGLEAILKVSVGVAPF